MELKKLKQKIEPKYHHLLQDTDTRIDIEMFLQHNPSGEVLDPSKENRMKANNGSGNIESRDEWETPQWLFDILHKQYNFNIDLCASNSNTKCNSFFDKNLLFENQTNFFKSKLDRCWMNPPFSKALEMFRHFFKVVGKGVAIYRCDNFETKIWQEVIFPNASWVFIPNKRIAYEGMVGSGSRFPSALIGFNVPVIESLDGITLTPFGAFNKDFSKLLFEKGDN